MDNGEGRMSFLESFPELEELVEKYPNHGSVFHIGETVKIKESSFMVGEILPNGLKLELLPK